MAQVVVGAEIADSESLSVVSNRNGYEHASTDQKVSLFESLSVFRGSELVTNSSKRRPQGGLPPVDECPATISLAEVRCRERLGGLLRHYSHAAA